MKIAFLIDKDSIFSTPNFIRLVKDISFIEKIDIDFIVSIKRCKLYDFIFALTDRYNDTLEGKIYNIYPLYMNEEINDILNNDLFYSKEYLDEYEYEEIFYYEKSIISEVIKDFKQKNQLYIYASNILDECKNQTDDFVVFEGELPVLVSAPHNVSQYYKGMYKVSDLNTGKITVNVLEKTKCFGIIKTKNIGSIFKDDNANRQLKCPYRKSIRQLVRENNIKALIDIHALKQTRKEQINLGVNGGNNIFNDDTLLNEVKNICKNYGFKVSIDSPFKGGYPTISNFASSDLGIYSLQIEINSKYINYIYKGSKYNKVVNMISEICNYLNESIK